MKQAKDKHNADSDTSTRHRKRLSTRRQAHPRRSEGHVSSTIGHNPIPAREVAHSARCGGSRAVEGRVPRCLRRGAIMPLRWGLVILCTVMVISVGRASGVADGSSTASEPKQSLKDKVRCVSSCFLSLVSVVLFSALLLTLCVIICPPLAAKPACGIQT